MHIEETRPKRIKLALTVGLDRFEVDGDLTLTEAWSAIEKWGALIGGRPGELAKIAAITADVEEETGKDTAALGTATT